MSPLPSKKLFEPNKNTKNTAYGRQFLWGTDDKVYQITVPNWHYPPYTALHCTVLHYVGTDLKKKMCVRSQSFDDSCYDVYV